jgi:hypothetical protein
MQIIFPPQTFRLAIILVAESDCKVACQLFFHLCQSRVVPKKIPLRGKKDANFNHGFRLRASAA